MNNPTLLSRRMIFLLICLLVVCLSTHFLHDLQHVHGDLPGDYSHQCTQAIHIALTALAVPLIARLYLLQNQFPSPELISRFSVLPVLLHPPIG
jgi:hypothetical protein